MYIWKKQTRAALYPNKIIMKKNKIKFIMMAFVFLFSILFLSNDYVQAAIHTIPDSNLSAVLNAKKMRMTKDNVSYKWNTTGGKVFHDDAGYEFAFPSTGTTGFRKQNSLTLNFTDVMKVNGRQVDAEVIVADLVVGNQTYTDEDGLWTPGNGEDGYISFLGVYENGISIGICRNGQRWMPEDVTLSTSFHYHDSGEKITSVPVYQTLADIDAYYDLSWNGHVYKNIKNEAWQGVSGYTGEIYQFDSCRLVTDLKELKLSAPKNSVTSGSDSYTVTGAIVTVNQDADKIVQTFTSTYCATEMMFYSPYGADKTISYLPDKGHYLVSVKADGEKLDMKDFEKSYDFKNINANHLIEVEYAPYHKVTTEIDQGTITEEKTNIRTGEDYTVTWTPADGRYVKKVTVNGIVFYEGNTVSGYPTSYDFSSITEDQDIKVETELIPEETTVPETTITEKVTTEEPGMPETTTQKETETTVKKQKDNILDNRKGTSPKTGYINKACSILFMIMIVTAFIGIVVFDVIIICSKRRAENKIRQGSQ